MPSRVRIKRPRTIAPRLASGDKRLAIGHGLPPKIKDGLYHIAYKENKSVSWVLEQIIIEYFGFDNPEYVRRKTDEPEAKSETRVNPHSVRSRAADR